MEPAISPVERGRPRRRRRRPRPLYLFPLALFHARSQQRTARRRHRHRCCPAPRRWPRSPALSPRRLIRNGNVRQLRNLLPQKRLQLLRRLARPQHPRPPPTRHWISLAAGASGNPLTACSRRCRLFIPRETEGLRQAPSFYVLRVTCFARVSVFHGANSMQTTTLLFIT